MTTSRKEIEDIFETSQTRSDHVYMLNTTRRIRHIYEDNFHKHPFHVCLRDRGKEEPIRWGCEIHPLSQSIHFDTIVHHILFYEPDKHKEYILNNTHFP